MTGGGLQATSGNTLMARGNPNRATSGLTASESPITGEQQQALDWAVKDPEVRKFAYVDGVSASLKKQLANAIIEGWERFESGQDLGKESRFGEHLDNYAPQTALGQMARKEIIDSIEQHLEKVWERNMSPSDLKMWRTVQGLNQFPAYYQGKSLVNEFNGYVSSEDASKAAQKIMKLATGNTWSDYLADKVLSLSKGEMRQLANYFVKAGRVIKAEERGSDKMLGPEYWEEDVAKAYINSRR